MWLIIATFSLQLDLALTPACAPSPSSPDVGGVEGSGLLPHPLPVRHGHPPPSSTLPGCLPILATKQAAWLRRNVKERTRWYWPRMWPVSLSERGCPASLANKRALESASALISLSMSLLQSPNAPTQRPRRSSSPPPAASSSSLACRGPTCPLATFHR